MTESIVPDGNFARRQNLGEEILNSITHGAGALLGIVGTLLLIFKAKAEGGLIQMVSVTIFGISMILLYLFSCLYHALPWSKGKAVFQVIDHCSIFLLILGTYAPIALVSVGGVLGTTLFAINAFCATLGITLNIIDLKRWKKFSLALYIIMGWMGVLAFPTILRNVSTLGFAFLVLGGLAYTIGVIFYKQKEKLYRHGVWHFFVLAGTVFHFFMIYMNCCSY